MLVNDHVVIPRGTEAHIRMVEDKMGGHLHGKSKGKVGAGVVTGNLGAVAGPVIAAFSAAKVDVKPGSRIQFTLESFYVRTAAG